VKFLIDNALPPSLADLLTAAGNDAVHVRSYQMQAAKDEEILARARLEERVIVSADSDFGMLLAAQDAEQPSFILFREPNLLIAADYFEQLSAALPALAPALSNGCVAVFRNRRLRVRKLPLSA
jgi:predicted nuclease of predicted toxin-antitoxin system